MRTIVFFAFCAIIWQHSFSQPGHNTFTPNHLKSRNYSLKLPEQEAVGKLPFNIVKVIDARFDTSKLGFISNKVIIPGSEKNFEKLRLKNGVAHNLEKYFARSCTSSTDTGQTGLLIVLKKFWVTSTRPYNNQKNSSSNIINGESRIIAKWELYIFKGEEYLPFRRVDTIIESKQSVRQLFKDENASYYNKEDIYTILNGLLLQFSYTNAIQKFSGNQKKTLTEILISCNSRFSIPVLTGNNLKQGVFLNFEEFQSNTPSVLIFKEKKGPDGSRYIADEKDDPITNFWGHSGKHLKIGRYDSETAFRIGRTFEFFKKVKTMSTAASHMPFFTDSGGYYWIPYQVDMEKGEFY